MEAPYPPLFIFLFRRLPCRRFLSPRHSPRCRPSSSSFTALKNCTARCWRRRTSRRLRAPSTAFSSVRAVIPSRTLRLAVACGRHARSRRVHDSLLARCLLFPSWQDCRRQQRTGRPRFASKRCCTSSRTTSARWSSTYAAATVWSLPHCMCCLHEVGIDCRRVRVSTRTLKSSSSCS